jgi:hypothetical protein
MLPAASPCFLSWQVVQLTLQEGKGPSHENPQQQAAVQGAPAPAVPPAAAAVLAALFVWSRLDRQVLLQRCCWQLLLAFAA